MKYTATLDKQAVIITVIISVLFFSLIVVDYCFIQETIVPSITSLLLVVIYAIAYATHPVYYLLDDEQLLIHTPVKNIVIPRNTIASVSMMEEKQLRNVIRTFGVGGLFGYFGRFSSYSTGNMVWYATRRKNVVLVLLTDGRKIIVTPDAYPQFLAAFGVSQ